MNDSHFDFLIVGAGLAGSILAHHLVLLNKKIAIVHSPTMNSSSRVAAGLYNPITGRKMTKTWKANDLFPYLHKYYKDFQVAAGCSCLNDMPMFRPFLTLEDQNEWQGRSADSTFDQFLDSINLESKHSYAYDHYGGLTLKQTGFLSVGSFLSAMHQHLLSLGMKIIEETFEFNELNQFGVLQYKSQTAEKIIFCDGSDAAKNPLFKWLPFKLVKGEILEIEADLPNDLIINRGVFVIPLGNKRFKVGSTYNNREVNWETSDEGKSHIEAKLKELINVNYTVVAHYAGVRPATRDRKPFIGMHPKYKNVGIFNGLGAKGVSLSPYFANQFALHLVNQSALDQEVAIDRYFKFYEA